MNNNRNNNGIGETLFWKVFSNVYLLNYIINKVQTVEWLKYNDHKKINRRNRLKFKEIFLLDWIVEKKQYPLLKYKIKCGEFIQIDLEAVEYIFEHLSKLTERIKVAPDPISKKYIPPEEITLKKEKKEIDRKKEIISLNQIIKLLLDLKRTEFEICDLTKVAVKYDCLDALRILTNEPYSIIVYPSTLESAILDCHPSMVKELLSLNQFNLVTDEIKFRSLKLAAQNEDHHNEMVEFILDNPTLYQIRNKSEIPIQSSIPSLESVGMITKFTDLPFEYSITFSEFYKLTNVKTKNKLMELDIILKIDSDNILFSMENDLNINQSFEEMVLLDKIHSKYFNGLLNYKSSKECIENIIIKYGGSEGDGIDQINKELKLKELVKLLIIKYKTKKIYNEYILKYKESIDEYHNDGYITNDNNDDDYCKFITLFRYIGFNSDINRETFKIQMETALMKVKDQQLPYYQILDFIEIKSYKRILNINNQEILDWLIKCNFEIISSFIHRQTSIQISTLELRVYAHKHYNLSYYLSTNPMDGSLSNCFMKAFKECDIDKLKALESHTEVRLISTNLQLPDDEIKINKLIDHYNNNDFKGLPMPFFYEIFKCAITKVPSISFSNVKKDFSTFPLQTTDLWFVSSILALDFRITEIFFNSFKHIIFTENQFLEFRNAEKNLFDSNKSVYHHYDYDENELISIVGKLMNKFNEREILQDGEKCQIEIQSYQAIFNYYFQILIQIEFISLDKVYSIHKLLIENSFEIQHTIYHSFYYLQLRNPKFIKYLLNRPGIDTFFDAQINSMGIFSGVIVFTDPYTDQHVGKYNGLNYQKHLNINEFTFDFILGVSGIDTYNDNKRIFKHSFDEILGKLVMELSIKLSSTQKQIVEDFYTSSMNEDLNYFLDIKRFDLFFTHLDYIQSKLQKEITSTTTTTTTITTTTNEINQDIYKMFNSKTTFKFTDMVIDLIVKLLYPSDLQRFLEFKFHLDTIVRKVYNRSAFANRYDNCKFLLDNYSIDINVFPSYPVSQHYNFNHRGEFKFITDNYLHKVSNPSLFKYNQNISPFKSEFYPSVFFNQLLNHLSSSLNISDYYKFISLLDQNDQTIVYTLVLELQETLLNSKIVLTDEDSSIDKEKKLNLKKIISNNLGIQSLIKFEIMDKFIQLKLSKFEIEKDQLVNEYLDQDDSMFNESFINGDIIMCNLILNRYPSIFKITKQSIKKVIESDKIHIIKYFYNQDNCKLLINNFQSDQELLQYLKEQLSIHPDYKYNLNWL